MSYAKPLLSSCPLMQAALLRTPADTREQRPGPAGLHGRSVDWPWLAALTQGHRRGDAVGAPLGQRDGARVRVRGLPGCGGRHGPQGHVGCDCCHHCGCPRGVPAQPLPKQAEQALYLRTRMYSSAWSLLWPSGGDPLTSNEDQSGSLPSGMRCRLHLILQALHHTCRL